MGHLSPRVFVDLLDGTVADTAVSHLASCASCRNQLAELRATRQAAFEAGVPEPSPLFWNHLSARVRDAVAGEPAQVAPWWHAEWSWRIAGFASAAAAAIAVAVALQAPNRAPMDVRRASAPDAVVAGSGVGAAVTPSTVLPDDEPLGFVADLMGDLDWDAVSELGLAGRGGADRVVAEMNDGERVELQRLLSEALAGGV